MIYFQQNALTIFYMYLQQMHVAVVNTRKNNNKIL